MHRQTDRQRCLAGDTKDVITAVYSSCDQEFEKSGGGGMGYNPPQIPIKMCLLKQAYS